ncbi:MAG TPA: glycoside hydrolase family 97 N-terminal domain-containing protein [Candidatus Sulfotelmatobacter sp.]|nr:glycoside hydrolase family 97 N-terminal domain-containing protein [Candidatus Sulfotelmatobacter sp.]
MSIFRLIRTLHRLIGGGINPVVSIVLAAAFFGSVGDAQTIYFDSFSLGTDDIWGTAPDTATSQFGGTNTATWNDALGVNDTNAFYADGLVGTGQGDSILLPFKPQSGYTYTLTASMTFSGNPGSGDWVGVGFAQNDSVNVPVGDGRFSDSANGGPNGYDWVILTESTGNVQFFTGPHGTGQLISQNGFFPANTPATHNVKLILDTTGAQWAIACYVDGVQAATTTTYASNPSIGAVGITQTTLPTPGLIHWNSFTLSVTQLAITQQPASAAVVNGNAFTNTVVITSSSTPYYQWFTNGIAIGAATNASLILDPVTSADAGTNYFVVVTNSSGAVTSAVVSLTVLTNAITNMTAQLTSPDGSLVLTFAVTNFDGSMSCPVYSLARNGQTLITTSRVGLTFNYGGLLQNYLSASNTITSASNSVWQPVYAETSSITNNYNQLVVNLQELIPPNRLLQLTFRAYNEGAAFCYTIPVQAGFAGATNLTEQTEFRFATNYPTWATYTAQGVYAQTNINGIISGCERPLPVQLATNLYVALGEAGLVNYSRMKFGPQGEPDNLISVLDGPVTNSLPLTTPWRFILTATNPGQLLENDYLVLNLNAPCALTNTSWIKPGKVIREVTLTTAGAMACVDFAALHNLQYIEFDAGWYGNENTTAIATNVVSSLNLPAVISYGASKNIGVILYVNWLAMTNELALLPPLYSSWGVKGIKYGFVDVGAQQYTAIVNSAAVICASNQMMMEVHDEFRPSGYTRTYPNFMSVEGVLGDESTPTATQDTTTFFSRLLVGGEDHTMCYFDPRVTNNWTYAYQLAKSVCSYSPWQYIYWYDRPTNSSGYVSGGNDMITEVPEMEFWNYLPTVWDETRVLQSSIGQYAVIARRSGTQWFVGAMNANSNRTFNVSLDFLTPGQPYVANVYSQDPSVPTRTHVRIDRTVVNSTTNLTMTLGATNGEAIRLLPATPPFIQALSPVKGGGLSLTVTGTVSQPYSLWSSPSPALPVTNWNFLGGGLITNNPAIWSDSFSPTQRFYRSSTP